jgi:hypothetical protein
MKVNDLGKPSVGGFCTRCNCHNSLSIHKIEKRKGLTRFEYTCDYCRHIMVYYKTKRCEDENAKKKVL